MNLILSDKFLLNGYTVLWNIEKTKTMLGIDKYLHVVNGFFPTKSATEYRRDLMKNRDVDVIKLRDKLFREEDDNIYAVMEAFGERDMTIDKFIEKASKTESELNSGDVEVSEKVGEDLEFSIKNPTEEDNNDMLSWGESLFGGDSKVNEEVSASEELVPPLQKAEISNDVDEEYDRVYSEEYENMIKKDLDIEGESKDDSDDVVIPRVTVEDIKESSSDMLVNVDFLNGDLIATDVEDEMKTDPIEIPDMFSPYSVNFDELGIPGCKNESEKVAKYDEVEVEVLSTALPEHQFLADDDSMRVVDPNVMTSDGLEPEPPEDAEDVFNMFAERENFESVKPNYEVEIEDNIESKPEMPWNEPLPVVEGFGEVGGVKEVGIGRETQIAIADIGRNTTEALELLRAYMKLSNSQKEEIQVKVADETRAIIEDRLNNLEKTILSEFKEIKDEKEEPVRFLPKRISVKERAVIDKYIPNPKLKLYLSRRFTGKKYEVEKKYEGLELVDGVEEVLSEGSDGLFEFISKYFPFIFLEYKNEILNKIEEEL